MGSVFKEMGRPAQAAACFEQVLKLNPDSAAGHAGLAAALQAQGQLQEAAEHYKQVLRSNPDDVHTRHMFAEAHNNLGGTFLNILGKLDESLSRYREAIRLQPDSAAMHSNLLLALNYDPRAEPQAVFAEHREFARRYAQPLAASILPHANERSPDRRLKIGYVSGDFRNHSVAHFIEPVLAQHDRGSYDVFCYFNHPLADAVTQRLQSYGGPWRTIAGKPDEQVAQQIRDDGIDILVDLSGHTGDNRLLVFARQPAPVQVTWLGYPNTTGLPTMDYRLTDGFADPPGLTEPLHTEQLVRLPETFSCFRAPEGCPEVSELPLLKKGYPTFGSFNNPAKITPEVMKVWAKILQTVPASKLMLKLLGTNNIALRQAVYDQFAALDIGRGQLELIDAVGPQGDHLQRYHAIDIALDPFPYNGTTTNCDALWMGVPVVTLAGRTHVSRVGTSQLSNLGLTELIAHTPEDYVRIAVQLAGDTERLKTLRAGLRERMVASPLMDATRFTRHLEAAYRQMWRRWCETGS
jgi:predicted O-linked N-acetylglucosamine transferase (SPINDLY family)